MSELTSPAQARLGPDRVLVAGAGVGGLEAALALRAWAGALVRVDVLAPERCFTYRPPAVGDPCGGDGIVRAQLREIAADRGLGLIRDALESVDAVAKQVCTQDGAVLSYDTLVLSIGARPWTAVPDALIFRGPRDIARLRAALEALADLPFPAITFVAADSVTWTLPLYELALLTDTWSRERGLSAEIRIVTAERRPVDVLGSRASEEVAEILAQRGIRLHTGASARRVAAGLTVALPALAGPDVPGLPGDALGFVPVDDFCRVEGLDDVYAIGDMTQLAAGQGGLAAQMAGVAAASIAAAAGAPVRPEPFTPLPNGHLQLLTGQQAPWWPSGKVMGAHLSAYLAAHVNLPGPVVPGPVAAAA